MSKLIPLLLLACGGSPPPAQVANAAPPDAATAPAMSNSEAVATSQAFFDLLAGSRPRIQRCYERALKTSGDLQNRGVTLELVARFTDGQHTQLTTSPSLGAPFEAC